MTAPQNKAAEYFRREGFLPVDKASYPLFKEYDADDMRLHETTAVTSTIWAFFFNALYKVIHGYLCSVWFYQNGSIYLIVQRPGGIPEQSLQQIIDTLYDSCIKAGLSCLQVWAIEERFLKEYQALEGYAITNEYTDDWSEYSYRPNDVLELSGGVNAYKRRKLNKIVAMPNTLSLRPITNENIRLCLAIQEEWCCLQDCTYCGSFAGCEKTSLENMIAIFDEHVFNGCFLYLDNNPIGYAIWEKTKGNLVFIYYAQSVLPNFNVCLYYMMTKEFLPDVESLNNTHDMGKPGLRLFKQHLGIYKQLRKYLCTFTKPSNHRQPSIP